MNGRKLSPKQFNYRSNARDIDGLESQHPEKKHLKHLIGLILQNLVSEVFVLETVSGNLNSPFVIKRERERKKKVMLESDLSDLSVYLSLNSKFYHFLEALDYQC